MEELPKEQNNTNIDNFFQDKKKTFLERLSEIQLTEDEERKITVSKTKKTIRDELLGVFPLGKVIKTVVDFDNEVEAELKERKKEHLLSTYFNKTDETRDALKKLTELTTNPLGNILFNKTARILDKNSFDEELAGHLANSIKNISNSDFQELFEDHKYALNQIELLSPQALTLLSDFKLWKPWKRKDGVSSGLIMSNNEVILNDNNWMNGFLNSYFTIKNITDKNIAQNIAHALNDLRQKNFVQAYGKIDKSIPIPIPLNAELRLTKVGQRVVKYLN